MLDHDGDGVTGLTFRGVLIRILLVMMIALILLAQQNHRTKDESNSEEPAGRGLLVLPIGRYLVGIQDWLAGANLPEGQTIETPPLDELENIMASDEDRFALLVVAGEIQGAEVALARLDVLLRGSLSGLARRDLETLQTLYRHGPDAIAAEDRPGIVERHGWFGELAFTHGLDRGDPGRREVIRPARRQAIFMAAASGLLMMALVVGVVLSILGVVLYRTGTLKRAYRPQRPSQGPVGDTFLGVFILFLAGVIVAGLVAVALASVAVNPPLGMLQALLLFIPLLLPWFGVKWPALRHGLGWERGRGVFIEMGCGIVGYLACLPIVAVGFLFSVMLIGASPAGEVSHPVVAEMADAGSGRILWLFVVACVLAPLVEETMFRGAFYHHLRQRYSCLVSGLVTGFIFAVIHPQGLLAVPALSCIGLSLALIREWRGSIVGPMTAHALNNGFVVTLLVLMFG